MKRAEIEYGYSPAVDRAVIARVNMNRLEAILSGVEFELSLL